MTYLKSIFISVILALAILLTIPSSGSADPSCSIECQDLCGDPLNSFCQYTTCEGAKGTISCTGVWQG